MFSALADRFSITRSLDNLVSNRSMFCTTLPGKEKTNEKSIIYLYTYITSRLIVFQLFVTKFIKEMLN